MKNNNGITLVALVISIIVLLILAGVSMSAVVGDNGITSQATLASEITKEMAEEEQKQFEDVSDYIDNEILKLDNSKNQNNGQNEYGFYFEQFYNTTLDSNKVSIIFYEDTSAKMYMNDVLYTDVPTGYIIYVLLKIDCSAIDFGIGTVSPNGKEINIEGIIFVLEEPKVINLPSYIRIVQTDSSVYLDILSTPPSTPQESDMYITKDYMYTYRSIVSDNDFIGWRVDGVTTSEIATLLKENFDITIEDTLKPTSDGNYGPILSHINNIPVVAACFANDTAMIVSPELPDTIVDLEDAFYGCTSLKTITNLPRNLQSLHQTFADCTSLKTLNVPIPNTVYTMDHTFHNCTSLIEAPTLPNDLTNIYGTFEGCTNLKTYEGSNNTNGDFSNYIIPENVTSLTYTFKDCTLLTITPSIPESVTYLEETFKNCTSLIKAPTLPNGLTHMRAIFEGCINLKTYEGSNNTNGDFSNYTIPENITSMDSLFKNCTSLTIAPTVPENVFSLRETFANCTSLTKAPTIPEKVQYLGKTFFNCTSLTGNITINSKAINSTSHLSNYQDCFKGTIKAITITGSCSQKAKIAATADNNNVTY